MGTAQSTLQYQDIARQALARARGLQMQIRGPPCRGAIVDYCEGRLDARRLIQRCTPLEANEFARLAAPIYVRWISEHLGDYRCVPGRCQYPRDGLHIEGCEFHIGLPPEIALSREFFVTVLRQPGIPELEGFFSGSRSNRHAHASRGESGRNGHRDYSGYRGHQSHSGRQGHPRHQGHYGHQDHLCPRRQRDHQSHHGDHQARPGRRRAPHDEAPLDLFDEFPSIDHE